MYMSREEKERILRGVEELTDLSVLRRNIRPLDPEATDELRQTMIAEQDESELRTVSR